MYQPLFKKTLIAGAVLSLLWSCTRAYQPTMTFQPAPGKLSAQTTKAAVKAALKDLAVRLFVQADRNGDDRISPRESENFWRMQTSIFTQIDTNHDDYISLKELLPASVAEDAYSAIKKLAPLTLNEADTTKNQKLSLDEALDGLEVISIFAFLTPNPNPFPNTNQDPDPDPCSGDPNCIPAVPIPWPSPTPTPEAFYLRTAFKMSDRNNDGMLTVKELEDMMTYVLKENLFIEPIQNGGAIIVRPSPSDRPPPLPSLK